MAEMTVVGRVRRMLDKVELNARCFRGVARRKESYLRRAMTRDGARRQGVVAGASAYAPAYSF